MDNIHADHELDAKTLRRAVNADVLDSGKIRRRKGFSPFLAEPGATLALRNPETGALTGQTITHGELYAILWSLAMESAALQDASEAAVSAP